MKHSLRSSLNRAASAAALLVTVVFASACSSAKGAPNAPELADGVNVSFTSQTENASNAVALRLLDSSSQSATFEVVLQNVSQPVTGAALELSFDPATVSFDGAAAGSFLKGANPVAKAALAARQPGKLVAVFSTRDLAQAQAGSGVLGTISFQLHSGSYSNFIALNANASTLFGVNGAQISGEGFVGGTLNVRG